MIVFKKAFPQAGMPEYQGVTQYYEGQIVELGAVAEKDFVDRYFAEYYDNKFDYYQPYDLVSDPSGAVIGLTGPNGNMSMTAALRSRPIRLATFGDSTASAFTMLGGGTPAGVPSPTADTSVLDFVFPAGSGSNIQFIVDPMESYIGRHNKLFYVFNGGISGQNTTQMLARDLNAASATRAAIVDLLDAQPDVVVVRAGINDVQTLTAASTPSQVSSVIATAVNNHKQIVGRIASGGAYVIVESLFGYSVPARAADFAVIRSAMLQVNEQLKAYYAGVANVFYIDFAGKSYDPATGAFYQGIAADGLHPNTPLIPLISSAEREILTGIFGAEPMIRYDGKNWFRNAKFFEEAPVAQSFGTTPGGFNVISSANVTRQNAKIELIDGEYWFTCEFVPDATVNAATVGNGRIVLPFAFSSIMTAAGATATSIAGLEVDVLFQSLDGTPVFGNFYFQQINFFKTVGGTQNGRIVLTLLSQGGESNVGNMPASVKTKFYQNPFRTNEPAANIDDTRASDFSFSMDVREQKAFKLGVKNPRLVFLDQTFFNA